MVIRSALLPIGVFLLVLTVGLGVNSLWRSVRTPPVEPPLNQAPAIDLSRPGPLGWTGRFAWSEEISPTSDLAVSENRIATINANGSLVILSADTGELVWASEPKVISRSAKPVIADAGGIPVAAILDGSTLHIARLEGSEPSRRLVDRALPPQSMLSWTGGSLLVTGPTGTWRVNRDLDFERVSIPDGEQAMAAGPDSVISAPESGDWLLTRSGGAGERVEPARPSGAQGSPRPAWSARGIVFAWWDTEDSARKVASLHDAADGELLATGEVSDRILRQGMLLTVSPGRQLASVGPMLVDLKNGHVDVDEAWSSVASPNDSYLYGTRDGRRATWDGMRIEEADDASAVPWGTSRSGLAIVLDRAPDGTMLVGGLVPN